MHINNKNQRPEKMSSMLKSGESINVYETFQPFYWTLKFFGFVSFQLDHKTARSNVRFVDVFWTFLWFCWSVFLLLINIIMGDEDIGDRSVVVRKGLLYLLCFELLACCLIIIFHFIKRDTIATYLKLLHEFDELVSKLLVRMKWVLEPKCFTNL